HQAIPRHGCVLALPACVSPGKIIVAPPRPSVSTSGWPVIRECLQSVPFAIAILEHQRIIDADPGAPFNCCTAHKLKTVPLNFSLAVNCYMYYSMTICRGLTTNSPSVFTS